MEEAVAAFVRLLRNELGLAAPDRQQLRTAVVDAEPGRREGSFGCSSRILVGICVLIRAAPGSSRPAVIRLLATLLVAPQWLQLLRGCSCSDQKLAWVRRATAWNRCPTC